MLNELTTTIARGTSRLCHNETWRIEKGEIVCKKNQEKIYVPKEKKP
jgi:hypothetical protein